MPAGLTANEEAQLLQTIEMFEVITQSQPLDYQSLEILKEAYSKLGRQAEVVGTSKRIAEAYFQLGQLSSAIMEYETILQLFPNDPDVQKALAEIENKANSFGSGRVEADLVDKGATATMVKSERAESKVEGEIDDGRVSMHRIFVQGKLVSESDFAAHWRTPSMREAPRQVFEPFVQVLADKGLLPLSQSIKVLCEKARLSFLPIEKYDVDVDLARGFPREICQRWCILPFDRMSKSVMIATANPFNKQAGREVEGVIKNRVLWYMVDPSELVKVMKKIFR